MRRGNRVRAGLLCMWWPALSLFAQTALTQEKPTVPPLVKFSGLLAAGRGGAGRGVVGITFAIYAEQTGGAPLWMEIQNVETDDQGRYTATLGTSRNEGLPSNLFASGQARWLGVQGEGGIEQPRALLVSVPYALKAADAEALGGLPASAFALATQPVAEPGKTASNASSPFSPRSTAPGGTAGFVPLWADSSGDLGNSVLFQSNTGTSPKIGIGTTTPATVLDVKGAATVRGALSASSYQIGSNPFALGNFANSNAFLGFAGNTVVTGTNNTGSGAGALSGNTSGLGNTANGNSALFFNTGGSYNTANGSLALYHTNDSFNTANGFEALYLNSSQQNTATGAEALNHLSGEAYNVGFLNTADGFQALYNATGASNTASGAGALFANTTGVANAALGASALAANIAGGNNTAAGYLAGGITGTEQGSDTFVGYQALPGGSGQLTYATAIGANAVVSESNAIVLGGTGASAVSVGIGTATPYYDYALDVEATPGGLINGGVVSDALGGNIYLGMTNGVHKFRVDTNGVTYADGGFQSSGADFAESLAVRGQRTLYEPGDVLEIDETANRRVTLSHQPYATLVAGIYSTKPGLLATPQQTGDGTAPLSEVPLAVVGIVPCKVTTENGAIARGDLLVTSSRPGYAMKGTDRRKMLGAVVAKALEPLPGGTGVIHVLVKLQ